MFFLLKVFKVWIDIKLECFDNFLDFLDIFLFLRSKSLFLNLLEIFPQALNILFGFVISQSMSKIFVKF
jgi:hypothetical protein